MLPDSYHRKQSPADGVHQQSMKNIYTWSILRYSVLRNDRWQQRENTGRGNMVSCIALELLYERTSLSFSIFSILKKVQLMSEVTHLPDSKNHAVDTMTTVINSYLLHSTSDFVKHKESQQMKILLRNSEN